MFYEGDARTFRAYAAALVAGQPFDNGIPFHPPGWPLVLSLFFRLIGDSPLDGRAADPAAVKLLVASIGGLTVGLTTLFAARLVGSGAMLAVALLGTFHFGHVVQGGVPTSEPLYGLLTIVFLLLTDVWITRDTPTHEDPAGAAAGWRVWSSGVLGALGGLASLVRPEFVASVLVLAVAHWRSGARAGRARLTLGAYALGFCAVLVPTTVWHWQSVSHFNADRAGRMPGPLPRFAPVTNYGAFNFAMANHPDADGGPNRDHPLLAAEMLAAESGGSGAIPAQAELDLASPAVYELYVHGYAIGARWLLANPRDALALWWQKAAMASGVFAYGYLHDDVPAGVGGTRRRVDQLDPARRWLWPIHVVLVLAGAALVSRGGDQRLLLAAPLFALASSTMMFFGYVRLAVAYLPIFWILQGAAVSALLARVVPSDTWRRRAPALVLAAGAVLLLVEGVGARHARLVTLDGPRDASGAVVQDETLSVERAR